VDDLIFMDKSQRLIDEFKKLMKLEFEMTYLETFASQGAYDWKILQKFGMHDCNPIATPMKLGAKLSKLEGGEVVDSNNYRSIIGSLRYPTCTRPDIVFTVGITSRFMEDTRYSHIKVMKRTLKYIKGTEDLRLLYQKTNIF
jgi:hypothetical protein